MAGLLRWWEEFYVPVGNFCRIVVNMAHIPPAVLDDENERPAAESNTTTTPVTGDDRHDQPLAGRSS